MYFYNYIQVDVGLTEGRPGVNGLCGVLCCVPVVVIISISI